MSYRLRLPATSANLGPGFDALGLALGLWLDVEAEAAPQFSVAATGRDVSLVGSLEGNLLLETYRELAPGGPALDLRIRNEIPLGMGCGSSAAALLAGVMLANQFGELGLTADEVLNEACRREGHPDNVAACFYGGLTVSAMSNGKVETATFGLELPWRLLVALPEVSLATSEARAMLPDTYSRADVVMNLQATALLVAAFAQGRPELLKAGTRDFVHQPYRMGACPLLASLLPLAGCWGIHSVTLSGAGPSVLLIVDGNADLDATTQRIREASGVIGLQVLPTAIARGACESHAARLHL